MVLISDGYSEIGAHVQSDLGYPFIGHLFSIQRSHKFFFHQTCATCSELPCNLAGKSEIGAHGLINLGYLICLRLFG